MYTDPWQLQPGSWYDTLKTLLKKITPHCSFIHFNKNTLSRSVDHSSQKFFPKLSFNRKLYCLIFYLWWYNPMALFLVIFRPDIGIRHLIYRQNTHKIERKIKWSLSLVVAVTLPSGLEMGKWMKPCWDLTGLRSMLTNTKMTMAIMSPVSLFLSAVSEATCWCQDWSDHNCSSLSPWQVYLAGGWVVTLLTTHHTALGPHCPGYLYSDRNTPATFPSC